jgi:hypothetical protein
LIKSCHFSSPRLCTRVPFSLLYKISLRKPPTWRSHKFIKEFAAEKVLELHIRSARYTHKRQMRHSQNFLRQFKSNCRNLLTWESRIGVRGRCAMPTPHTPVQKIIFPKEAYFLVLIQLSADLKRFSKKMNLPIQFGTPKNQLLLLKIILGLNWIVQTNT